MFLFSPKGYGLEYEMIRATAGFEHAALKPLFLLNGGALIVYFGLIASKRDTSLTIDFSIGRIAVGIWALGLVLATSSAILGAFSQFAFRRVRGEEVARDELDLGLRPEARLQDIHETIGEYSAKAVFRRKIAIASGVTSLALFVLGFWPAFSSIK